MSKMEAQHGHSSACCNIPPIVSKGYEGKGKYETVGGIRSYVTGPTDSPTAILFIHDIFGYYPQTVQGADILASSSPSSQHLVFVPDLFGDAPADISWYPPDTPEKQEKLGAFFKGPAEPMKTAKKILEIAKSFKEQYPDKALGIIGFCWGAKIVSLTSGSPTPFVVAAKCHPAMVDPADAPKISIPVILLASKDEDPEAVKAYEANLKGESYVETFGDQIHGWMGGRSDLENPRVKEEYERGYKTVVEFFAKHLK